jgi:hypothetical protein
MYRRTVAFVGGGDCGGGGGGGGSGFGLSGFDFRSVCLAGWLGIFWHHSIAVVEIEFSSTKLYRTGQDRTDCCGWT